MEIKGKLKEITKIEQIPTKAGKTFEKRNLILDCSRMDEWTGDVYTNILCFDIAPSKVHDFDAYLPFVGQSVTVRFAINGRETENGMGEKRYFTTLRCIGVDCDGAVATAPVAQPQVQQPAPAQPQVAKQDPNLAFATQQNESELPF